MQNKTLSEYRNNGWSWVGVLAPWVAGVACAYWIDQSFAYPERHSLASGAIFLSLIASIPALLLPYGRWGGIFASATALMIFGACVAMLVAEPNAGAAHLRFAWIVLAEVTMVATTWSFLFGWIAVWVGDHRYAATRLTRDDLIRSGQTAG